MASNLDNEWGPESAAQTATTGANTAPDSADFTKEFYRHDGVAFSASDFPFTDTDEGDSLHKVKIVALIGMAPDGYSKRAGVLRFDGVDVAAGQVVSASDLGKLKYVPQPDGHRAIIGASFTFRALDQDGSESPTYTVTLEPLPDMVLSLSHGFIDEASTPSSGGRVTVTATLTGPVRSDNFVIPQIRVDRNSDAQLGIDFTVNNSEPQLTILAGQKGASVTFEFTGIEDFLVEGDEQIRIHADWIVNGASPAHPPYLAEPVFLTLEDNDYATVSITGPPGEVEEGEDAVFTVALSRGITVPLLVDWGTTPGGSASLKEDFVALGGAVSFPAGSPDNATTTIAVPVVDDLVPEPAESFTVLLAGTRSKAATQVSVDRTKRRASAKIAESDAVTVSVSGDARVTEGESATYTISLDSAASTGSITVDYATTDKSAVAGTDYTAASGTVTIPAGQTSATVTVSTTSNTADKANRYFEFRMSDPQGGGGPTPLLSTTQFVNTTIVDDDGDPSSVLLSVDKTSFGEADAAGTVNVTATLEGGSLDRDVTVVVTLGGSATKGSAGDYTATTLGNITISAKQTSGTASFTVTPLNDEVVEGDETILIKGAVAHLDVTPATIAITDDDTATLGITADAALVVEGNNAGFTVTLSHEVAAQVVVAWSAGSTADVPASADDYAPDSGTVIFPAGSAAGATKTITMSIFDQSHEEEQETFTVTLGSVTGDLASRVSVDSAKSSADVSIATGEIVTVTLFGPRAFSFVESHHYASYQVFLSGPVNADIQLDIATSDGTATGCAFAFNPRGCTDGKAGDYGEVSRTLSIGPGQHYKTYELIFVYFPPNSLGDPDETFTVSISNLRGGGTTPVVLGNSSVTTTITSTPMTFSVSGPEFVDEGTNARFVVSRSSDQHTAFGSRVSYATSDGTAEAGKDYTAVSGTLEVATHSSVRCDSDPSCIDEHRQRYSDWEVLVPVLADNVEESDETFSLVISNPLITFSGLDRTEPGLLGTSKATTTISDRAMVVSVSAPETVVEGEYADFTVTLSRAPTANLRVYYQTYGALTPLPSASSGDDYTPQTGSLTFVPGETSKRVRVPILTDAVTERIEYFRLLLSSPTGGGGLRPTLGTSEATMGIVDAAGPLYGATLTLTPASDIGEGDGAATEYTVKVDLDCCTTFDNPIGVTMSLGGTAVVTDDYTATPVNVTIPANAATATATTKLSITPVEDEIVEGDETIIVNGSAPIANNDSVQGLAIIPTIVTLADNDLAHITLSVNPEYVQEYAHELWFYNYVLDPTPVVVTATRDGTAGDHPIAMTWRSGTIGDFEWSILGSLLPLHIEPGETSSSVVIARARLSRPCG